MPMNCERMVAMPAPRIPHSSQKMNMGANTMLQPTVSIDESMAFLGYPVARITLLSPIMTYDMGVPIRITSMKSWA